ncbi:MAG: hypothetical protein ABI076_10895 [Acidobacteriaceae bacterium]
MDSEEVLRVALITDFDQRMFVDHCDGDFASGLIGGVRRLDQLSSKRTLQRIDLLLDGLLRHNALPSLLMFDPRWLPDRRNILDVKG